jgi:alanine racemase
MDQCMADVTGYPVCEGDEVVFFGNDPAELALLARRAGTIEHEALCLIGGRVPRIPCS